MKISIITVCLNSQLTILDTINSVFDQKYNDIEYIIIDGGSTDNTINIINNNIKKINFILSEKDKGLYDAINKGISISTGEIIGILNSDDIFVDNKVVDSIVNIFTNTNIDFLYGDVAFIDKYNKIKRVYWINE
jgi:glycosyltransferase involved in cell wall biosynthesis